MRIYWLTCGIDTANYKNGAVMAIYRKKPVEIKAWHFTDENKDLVYHDLNSMQMNIQPTMRDGKPALLIPTLEGEMTASLNDYIIKGVHGELYPCKPDIFAETYELVRD